MSDDTRDPIAEALDVLDGGFDDAVTGNVLTDQPNVVEIMPDESDYLWIERSYLRQHEEALSLLRTELERRKVPDTDLLAALRKHDEAMTAGEWQVETEGDDDLAIGSREADAVVLCAMAGIVKMPSDKDAEGIAALRNLLPDIIAALEQADRDRTELERLRGMEAAGKALADAYVGIKEAQDDAAAFRATLDQRHTGGEG